jgi:arylsulfatase A-like enzyme
VPAVIEWPAGIPSPRITRHPAGTVDIFPTLAEVARLPADSGTRPMDGMSLLPLFIRETGARPNPLGFRHTGRAAFIDNNYKLVTQKLGSGSYELFDLDQDQRERHDLFERQPETAARLVAAFERWNASVESSVAGKDYPHGRVIPSDPPPKTWMTSEEYQAHLPRLLKRPEYRPRSRRGK